MNKIVSKWKNRKFDYNCPNCNAKANSWVNFIGKCHCTAEEMRKAEESEN